jgi:hypothetical protein
MFRSLHDAAWAKLLKVKSKAADFIPTHLGGSRLWELTAKSRYRAWGVVSLPLNSNPVSLVLGRDPR